MSAIAIATVIDQDWADVKEAEYQPGQWSNPLFNFSGYYWCCTGSAKNPPVVTDRYGSEFADWIYVGAYKVKTHVWKHKENTGA